MDASFYQPYASTCTTNVYGVPFELCLRQRHFREPLALSLSDALPGIYSPARPLGSTMQPIDDRAIDHLERLAERNRLVKARADKVEKRKEDVLRSREKGFDTLFSGANADRMESKKLEREREIQQHQLRLLKRKSAEQPRHMPPAPAAALASEGSKQRGVWGAPVEPAALRLPEATARRGWKQSTVNIRTHNGGQLRIRPSGADGIACGSAGGGPFEVSGMAEEEAPPGDVSDLASLMAAAVARKEAAACGPEAPRAEAVFASAMVNDDDEEEGESPEDYEDDFERDEGGSLRATLRAIKESMRQEAAAAQHSSSHAVPPAVAVPAATPAVAPSGSVHAACGPSLRMSLTSRIIDDEEIDVGDDDEDAIMDAIDEDDDAMSPAAPASPPPCKSTERPLSAMSSSGVRRVVAVAPAALAAPSPAALGSSRIVIAQPGGSRPLSAVASHSSASQPQLLRSGLASPRVPCAAANTAVHAAASEAPPTAATSNAAASEPEEKQRPVTTMPSRKARAQSAGACRVPFPQMPSTPRGDGPSASSGEHGLGAHTSSAAVFTAAVAASAATPSEPTPSELGGSKALTTSIKAWEADAPTLSGGAADTRAPHSSCAGGPSESHADMTARLSRLDPARQALLSQYLAALESAAAPGAPPIPLHEPAHDAARTVVPVGMVAACASNGGANPAPSGRQGGEEGGGRACGQHSGGSGHDDGGGARGGSGSGAFGGGGGRDGGGGGSGRGDGWARGGGSPVDDDDDDDDEEAAAEEVRKAVRQVVATSSMAPPDRRARRMLPDGPSPPTIPPSPPSSYSYDVDELEEDTFDAERPPAATNRVLDRRAVDHQLKTNPLHNSSVSPSGGARITPLKPKTSALRNYDDDDVDDEFDDFDSPPRPSAIDPSTVDAPAKPVWLQGKPAVPLRAAVAPAAAGPTDAAASPDEFGEWGFGGTAVGSLLRKNPNRGRRSQVDDLNASLSTLSSLNLGRRSRDLSTDPPSPNPRPSGSRGADPPPGFGGPDQLSQFMTSRKPRDASADDEFDLAGGGRAALARPPSDPMLAQCLQPSGPRMPPTRLLRCTTVRLSLLSTWGDPNYIGLSGVELSDDRGQPITLSRPREQLRATPSGVHELPGLQDDPRTVDKLVDGVNTTSDASHMWLAPFTPGERHELVIEIGADVTISRLRLWNYNASRSHAQRGARHCELRVDADASPVWGGELKCAGGTNVGSHRHVTDLIFTDDATVLAKLRALEESAGSALTAEEDDSQLRMSLGLHIDRPATAGEDERTPLASPPRPTSNRRAADAQGASPATMNMSAAAAHAVPEEPIIAPPMAAAAAATAAAAAAAAGSGCVGTTLTLTILSTWGDRNYFGLAGLELLDCQGMSIPMHAGLLHASPADLNELHGGTSDPRTVDKLVDRVNATTDSNHMWLAPWQAETGRAHTLVVTLESARSLAALRVWNYNKSEDDSYRGVQRVHVALDSVALSPPHGLLLRKGPGHALFDHAQLVPLIQRHGDPGAPPAGGAPRPYPFATPLVPYAPLNQDFWAPVLPRAHLWQLRLLSTWGDVHYIGLDGLQLFNEDGIDIGPGLAPEQLHASPADVNVLPDLSGDPRTIDKLFVHPTPLDGGTAADAAGEDTPVCPPPPGGRKAYSDVWLAPWSPKRVNELWVCFDEPVALSMIRLANYSKDPSRGVHEFEVLADGMLVYRGWLRQGGAAESVGWQSVVFNDVDHVLHAERDSGRLGGLQADGGTQPDVTLLWDEGKHVNRGETFDDAAPVANADVRPRTAINRSPRRS